MDENTDSEEEKTTLRSVEQTLSCFHSSIVPGTTLLRGLRCSGATNSTTNSCNPGRIRKTTGGAFAYRMLNVFLPLPSLYICRNLLSENNLKKSGHDKIVI